MTIVKSIAAAAGEDEFKVGAGDTIVTYEPPRARKPLPVPETLKYVQPGYGHKNERNTT